MENISVRERDSALAFASRRKSLLRIRLKRMRMREIVEFVVRSGEIRAEGESREATGLRGASLPVSPGSYYVPRLRLARNCRVQDSQE
jgi:hypothetical protein